MRRVQLDAGKARVAAHGGSSAESLDKGLDPGICKGARKAELLARQGNGHGAGAGRPRVEADGRLPPGVGQLDIAAGTRSLCSGCHGGQRRAGGPCLGPVNCDVARPFEVRPTDLHEAR